MIIRIKVYMFNDCHSIKDDRRWRDIDEIRVVTGRFKIDQRIASRW